MIIGTVKWFNNLKGFGFIESTDTSADIFAHYSEINMEGFKTLEQGAVVSYERVEGPRGFLAKNIQVISKPEQPQKPANGESGYPYPPSSRLRTPQFRANLISARHENAQALT